MAMSNAQMKGKMPGPSGEAGTSDGAATAAPMDMADACQAAADAAMAHRESSARTVNMTVRTPGS